MRTEIERAIEMYEKACQAECDGDARLAEIYYLKSWFLFEQAGGVHYLNAAHVLNMLANLRKACGDHDGALRSAQKSITIMASHGRKFPGAEADEICCRAWALINDLFVNGFFSQVLSPVAA